MSQCQIVSTDLLIEFLQVAFNNILYWRKLYPAELFVEKRVYAGAFYTCQHPELNEYLNNVLRAIREIMTVAADPLRVADTAINLNIFNKEKRLVEKYVFDISRVQLDGPEKDPYFIKIEEHLRKVCLKLSLATSYLKPLPDDSTFSINVETSQWVFTKFCHNSQCQTFPWISDDRGGHTDVDAPNALLPLTIIKSQYIQLEMFVLENK